jgi:hypothetical protein
MRLKVTESEYLIHICDCQIKKFESLSDPFSVHHKRMIGKCIKWVEKMSDIEYGLEVMQGHEEPTKEQLQKD